jgi:glycosyltransferase involved in cell wall biosynthesis/GT2 family glycosyltransferase
LRFNFQSLIRNRNTAAWESSKQPGMGTTHKLIYFSDAIFLGGAEEYLKLLVPEMNREKYEPRVALTQRPDTQSLAEFFEKRDVAVDFVEAQSRSPLKNFLSPLRYFRQQRPSIVHFNLNNPFGCFFPVLAAFCSGVPWRLATEHLAFELASGKRAGVRTKKLVKRILTFCLDYTIAVSQANKRLLVRDYEVDPFRVKLIRNCVDVDKYAFSAEGRSKVRQEFKITNDQFLIGTVARFSFQKGHGFTIEAIPQILEAFPQTRFLFVGDGPEHDRLCSHVRQQRLEPYVFFAGVREDIASVLSAMDVFLLTSIFEGLPLSILEAMAAGLPVVATHVSGTPEAVLHNLTGLLIPPGDSAAISGAVIELLSKPQLRTWMGTQGRALVRQQFNKALMIKQVEDIYDNLIAAHDRPEEISVSASVQKARASIIVLSWNKKELLKDCLDALQAAVDYDGEDHEIILVDNGSTDGTQDYVRTHYPRIRIIELDRNYRFCRANNIGVKCAKNEIVVLLNNDVVVERGFLQPLLKGFEHSDIFAVTSQIFNYDPSKLREETGKTFGTLVFGCVHVGHTTPNGTDEQREYTPVFYAGGGSSAYSRQKFLALGGFNEIYNPGYVEDADLSYRAWKAGYRVLFCPKSKVIHKHRSTNATQLGNPKIDYLISRNLFIFFWQNVTSAKLFAKHLVQLPLRILLDVSRGRFAILRAFLGALLRIPRIVWNRVSSTSSTRVSDEEALAVIDYWFFYRHKHLLDAQSRDRPQKILMISKRLPKLGFDGSWVLVNLIKGLSASHHITLLAFTETDEDKPYVEHLSQFCKEVRTITLYPYSRELKSSFLFSKLLAVVHAFLLMRKEVLNELKNGDYDLVHCEYLHTLNFIPNLRRFPSLLTHHEVLSLAHKRSFEQASNLARKVSLLLKWKFTQAYEKRICRKVKAVVALSPVDESYLKSKLRLDRTCVLQSGVDLDFFRRVPNLEEIPNSLVFVGYFKHPPNVEGLLYFFRLIWPELKLRIPDTRITVIGRYAPPEILAYSQENSVAFADYVPDIRSYLQQSTVFVAPIISGAGLRGKILEAMALENAVVATSRCTEGLSVQHDQELMIANDAEDFVNYTVDLLKDPAKRRRLGRNARAKVEAQFGAEQFTDGYEELYQQLFR